MPAYVTTLVVAYLLLALAVFVFADRLIFPAPPAGYEPRELEGFLWIESEDGTRIAASHLANPAARFTILYQHGNGEDLASIQPMLRELHALGFAVLAWDYRGYGASAGSPSAAAVLRDAGAVYRHLTGPLGVSPERIIIYGRSVGGGPAVHLAARHSDAAGLVLESTFTSAFRVVTRVPLFPFDRFRNHDALPDVEMPVLVIHGRRDRVVPFAHGERLYRLAPEPRRRLWLDHAGHNDVWLVGRREVAAALREFAQLAASDEQKT